MSEMFQKYKHVDTMKKAQDEKAAQQKKKDGESVIHAAVAGGLPQAPDAPLKPSGRSRALVIVALVLAVAAFGLSFKLALDMARAQSDINEVQVVIDDRSEEAGSWMEHTSAVEDEFRRAFKKDRERMDALEKADQSAVEALAALKDAARASDIEKLSKELKDQKDGVLRLQQRIDNVVAENKKLGEQLQALQQSLVTEKK
jgi:hypothetical protein